MDSFRGWRRRLVLSQSVVLVVFLAGSASAVPFVVGNTTCGDLKKARGEEGGTVWKLTGCDKLEALLSAPPCGNGVLDTNEFCDASATPTGCGSETCVNCLGCTSGPVPTPTPSGSGGPTPTPPPIQVGTCNRGEMPQASHATYPPGTRGVTRVQLLQDDSHVWCVTVDKVTTAFSVSLASEGAFQCLWVDVTVIPPPGYTPRGNTVGTGRDVSVGIFDSQPLPQGLWRIKIDDHSDCPSVNYQMFAIY